MIRAPRQEDIVAISQVCQRAVLAIREGQPAHLIQHWAAMLHPKRIEEMLQAQWGIVSGDPVHGFATLDVDTLGMLYVAPEAQGHGVARSLVQEVAREARNRGLDVLKVDASLNAHDAYLALGFADVARVTKTDTQGVSYDVFQMQLRL